MDIPETRTYSRTAACLAEKSRRNRPQMGSECFAARRSDGTAPRALYRDIADAVRGQRRRVGRAFGRAGRDRALRVLNAKSCLDGAAAMIMLGEPKAIRSPGAIEWLLSVLLEKRAITRNMDRLIREFDVMPPTTERKFAQRTCQ